MCDSIHFASIAVDFLFRAPLPVFFFVQELVNNNESMLEYWNKLKNDHNFIQVNVVEDKINHLS
jgi:hypothetical protein